MIMITMMSMIIMIMIIGIYSIGNSQFEILLLAIIGTIAYFLSRNNFDFSPLLLGYVLGPAMEENLRRSLLIFRGDITLFFYRPSTVIIFSIIVVMFIVLIYSKMNKNKLNLD